MIVNISRSRDTGGNGNGLIAMLTDLLNERLDAQSKLKLLQEKHGIPVTEEIKEEVRDMCTYTASVLAQGEALGEIRGEARGIVQGEERLAKLIKLLIAEKKYDEISVATENRPAREELYVKYGITEE